MLHQSTYCHGQPYELLIELLNRWYFAEILLLCLFYLLLANYGIARFSPVCYSTMVLQISIRQQWRSIILISSCAGSSLALRSVACVRNVMASASSATHTCAHARLFGSAMSATTAHSREGVWSAEESASQTPTTARSVPSRRRTGMVVPRLSILEAPRLISSTSGRSTGLRRDDWEEGVAGFYWPHVVFCRTDTESRVNHFVFRWNPGV